MSMCEVKTRSILRSRSYNDIKNFKWEPFVKELEMHLNKASKNATIGICAYILLQHQCSRMSLVQKMIRLLLHASHCGKQVKKINNLCHAKSYFL